MDPIVLQSKKDNETRARFFKLRGQGLLLAKIAAELIVSKSTVINWGRDFKEWMNNPQAVDSRRCTTSTTSLGQPKVEFFGDILSRIQRDLETRDLSSIPTEKLFAMYAHFYREA